MAISPFGQIVAHICYKSTPFLLILRIVRIVRVVLGI